MAAAVSYYQSVGATLVSFVLLLVAPILQSQVVPSPSLADAYHPRASFLVCHFCDVHFWFYY